MKLIDLPDYAKKYKTKGYDVKKINNEFYLYKVDHKRVDDKPYPVTSLTYIGKIDKNLGLIKAYTQKDDESASFIPMHTKYPDLDEESYGMAADKRVDEQEGEE